MFSELLSQALKCYEKLRLWSSPLPSLPAEKTSMSDMDRGQPLGENEAFANMKGILDGERMTLQFDLDYIKA